MKANIWKKNAVLATVILFVCVAVYLNWSYGRGLSDKVDAPDDQQGITNVMEHQPGGGSTVLGSGTLGQEQQGDDGEEQQDSTTTNDFFAQVRLTRQQARDGSLEILRESSEIADASQEIKDDTVAALNAIAAAALSEAKIESLVLAKGFTDCVAFISDSGVEIVVSVADGKLVSEQVSQVKDIVIAETGVSTAEINILEAK